MHVLRSLSTLAAGLAVAMLSGCAFGPRDGMFFVTGLAPANSPQCVLELSAGSLPKQAVAREVHGNFRQQFMVHSSGPFETRLSCGGTVVATKRFRYGGGVKFGGEVALGEVAL